MTRLFLAGVLVLLSISTTYATDSATAFTAYWKKFRQAVIQNDTTRIIEMTRFPFQIEGMLDFIGKKTINREAFSKNIKAYIDQDTRENLTPESMRDFVRKHETASFKVMDDEVSVGLFEFEYINGKWYFVRIYVEELE